jgi:hypothetical protein
MKKARKLTDQLRRAILESGHSRYWLSGKTGIDQAVLSRFIHGKSWLSGKTLDAIGAVLGLEIVARPRKRKGARR